MILGYYGLWEIFEEFLWSSFQYLFTALWPMIFIRIIDLCLIRDSTHMILLKQHINCFWIVATIDAISGFTSALTAGIPM